MTASPWSTRATARKRSASRSSPRVWGTRSSCTPGKRSRSWGDDRMTGKGLPGTGAMESLYPFLYPDTGTTDLPAVLEEVRRSTVAKAEEITEVRRLVSARDSARLMSCARDAAARFTGGGRLLAFGNGGSATDAQQLGTLFLDPGGDAPPLPALGLAHDTSLVTALWNHIRLEGVFARPIAAFGRRRGLAGGVSPNGQP